MKRRTILAGGSGFLGQALRRHELAKGGDVVVLTRSPRAAADGARECAWDGRSVSAWAQELEGADVLVNLSGRSVDCRYHARNRRLILDSRVDSTRALGEAVARCANPPRVWLNASTATIYRHTFGPAWDERGEVGATPEAKDAFSIEVATAWERELEAARTPRTRKVALRSAMVLGHARNSVFPVLSRLARWGLGGRMGSGAQFVSWIHEADFCRAIDWLVEHQELAGVVNVAAPNPVTNTEFMASVREAVGARCGLPAAAWMLEVGAFVMRTETELILKSRRVAPGRLLASGFEFRFPTVREALADLGAVRADPGR